MVIYNGFTHWTWWFSIAMLVFTRGYHIRRIENARGDDVEVPQRCTQRASKDSIRHFCRREEACRCWDMVTSRRTSTPAGVPYLIRVCVCIFPYVLNTFEPCAEPRSCFQSYFFPQLVFSPFDRGGGRRLERKELPRRRADKRPRTRRQISCQDGEMEKWRNWCGHSSGHWSGHFHVVILGKSSRMFRDSSGCFGEPGDANRFNRHRIDMIHRYYIYI